MLGVITTNFWGVRIFRKFTVIWYFDLRKQSSDKANTKTIFAPPTKSTKCHVCPTKTQISLGIRTVWSVFAVRFMVAQHPRLLHAHSEDWSDWADAQADLSLCWAHRSFCWFCHAVAHIYCHIHIGRTMFIAIFKPIAPMLLFNLTTDIISTVRNILTVLRIIQRFI